MIKRKLRLGICVELEEYSNLIPLGDFELGHADCALSCRNLTCWYANTLQTQAFHSN